MTSLKILGFFAIIIKQVNSMLLWLKHRRRQNLVRILETHSPIGSQPNSAQALSLLHFGRKAWLWLARAHSKSEWLKNKYMFLVTIFFCGFQSLEQSLKATHFLSGKSNLPDEECYVISAFSKILKFVSQV